MLRLVATQQRHSQYSQACVLTLSRAISGTSGGSHQRGFADVVLWLNAVRHQTEGARDIQLSTRDWLVDVDSVQEMCTHEFSAASCVRLPQRLTA